MRADIACMEHGLLIIGHVASLCARAALGLWLAGVLAGGTALAARTVLTLWRRKAVRPPEAAAQRPVYEAVPSE